MKVLLISPLPPPAGGMAFWTQQYIDYMKKNNYYVDLVNIAVMGKRALNYTKSDIFEEILRTVTIVKKTLGFLFKSQYSVAHLNTSCSRMGIYRDKIILDLLQIFRTKVVLHCHCNVDYAVNNVCSEKIFRAMVKKADKCVVLNKNSSDFIKSKYGIDTYIVPNFISDEYVDAVDCKKPIKKELKTALFVGHVLKTKGCDIIIEAAKVFPDIQFRIVGHISKEFVDKTVPPNVVLTGEKSQHLLRKEYEDADVLLFPTHTEGFPLTVVEAMAFGLPIVTTRVGAIPDILENDGAIYIPINSCKALVEAIEKVKNPEDRFKMSIFNKSKVTTYFIDNVLELVFKNIYKF